MEDIFKAFCSFGAKDAAPLMDNAKFAKFFRDMKLLDKKFTSTDADIFFTEVKAKTERKINFSQFEDALKLVAEKKFPGDAKGLARVHELILARKGPVTHATKTTSGGAVCRLTDTKSYTGSHKERFDESGKGKGIEGRKDVVDDSGYVTGFHRNDDAKKTT